MIFSTKLLTSLAVYGLAFSAFASGVGNGGVSVVCRDDNDRITSAQLLDIYEGEVRYSKRYENQMDADLKVELAQLKLVKHPGFLSEFQEELANVRAMLMYVPIGNELTPTNDAFPAIIKKGCEFEQLANYTAEGDLLVSQEIYNELSNVDRAALLVHETVYALFRKNGATDSRQARKFTAEILAVNADQKVIDKMVEVVGPPRSAGTCGTRGTIEQRIVNCNKSKGGFDLVAKTKEGHQVYRDRSSGLLWGDRLPSMSHYDAEHACSASLAEVAKISDVTWRLPSVEEYEEAEKNKMRKVLPNMNSSFWSSLVHRNNSDLAWLFDGNYGNTHYDFRELSSDLVSVRCVAR